MADQRVTFPERSPVAIRAAVALNATAVTGVPVPVSSVLMRVPVASDQRRVMPSLQAVARSAPPSDAAAALTPPWRRVGAM
ncbi:MAG: hypothetical protein P8J87_03380 [Verrucomicrobiales bacterium]|nr:hypothetical protein [Verrucomicrobiales bacterium]